MLKEYAFGFGDTEFRTNLPQDRVINVVEGKECKPVTNIEAAVKEALNNPIDSLPLRELVKKGDRVTIIASDITRRWVRYDLFLPALLNELNTAGIPDKDITLIIGLGSHRYNTGKENIINFGQQVVDRVSIKQSHAPVKEDFVYVGRTSRGHDAYINKHVAGADKVILTGGIVYHLMAGFGGGRKSIMPGISGYASIQANHSLCLHEEVGKGLSPNCVSGKLESNAMHEDMTEVAEMLKPAFLLNAVFTPDGKFARFVAGHWYKAWLEGTNIVKEIFGVSVNGKADLVIASAGGFPKDINLYQGAKALDNAYMAVNDNGVVILLLECRDIMEPPDFSAWFKYESLYERELALRKAFTVPGFIALMIGYRAKKLPHIVVSLPKNKEFIEKAGMIFAASLEEAMAIAEQKLGHTDYSINVMAHASSTVPLENGQ